MESLTARKIRILYLDDEPNNLTSFKAGFKKQFETYTATNVAEAMRVLTQHMVHVIVADQRMPGTTGTEFFHIVKKAFPLPIRILVDDKPDVESLAEAMNKGEVYRFILKPWKENLLLDAVQQAAELYHTRAETQRNQDTLQKSNDELNRFVYSTSHDLRGPLASTLAILNLIKIEKSVTDPHNYLEMIETCMKKMDLYVQKIIEYYKAVRIGEVPEMIDFNVMLNDAVRIAGYQNAQVKFNLSVDQPVPFYGDVFRINVILTNLISNAIKYQRPEEQNPSVNLKVKIDEQQAIVWIEDNGTGILDEHLNSIFDMFFRGQYSVNGLGIGLFIVKEALLKIGGDINVRSEVGKGSVFQLYLPNSNPELNAQDIPVRAEAKPSQREISMK